MKYKSRAIALTYIKHGDSSIISKLFTEEKGLQVFFVRGVRSKKSKKKLVFFQPLQQFNIDANHSKKKNLQTLNDITIYHKIKNNSFLMHKNFLAIFIAEVTASVLRENEANRELFYFIWDLKLILYNSENIERNFALIFMLKLSQFLGIKPSIENINKPYFDLENGNFSDKNTLLNIYLSKEKSNYLKSLLCGKDVLIPFKIKSELLKDLITYFNLHHYNLKKIKSHLILETLK